MGPEVVLSGVSGANHVQGCLCHGQSTRSGLKGHLYAGLNYTCRFQRVVVYVFACRKALAGRICNECQNQCLETRFSVSKLSPGKLNTTEGGELLSQVAHGNAPPYTSAISPSAKCEVLHAETFQPAGYLPSNTGAL